jgi:Uma2 family endonuclease
VLNLVRGLDRWVRAAPGRGMLFDSPMDVQLSERSRVQPDVAWWAAGLDLDVRPAPPPDLAIEVLSPSTRRRDVGVKRLAYAQSGVAELWLVDPLDRSVTVLQPAAGRVERRAGEERLTTPLMPGLDLLTAALFPP